MLRAAAPLLLAGAASAQTVWYGLSNGAAAGSLTLNTLSNSGAIDSTIGTTFIGAGEVPWYDGFRCVRGFCLFTTTAFVGGAPSVSFVYNVSSVDAKPISRTPCPGLCRDMHVDWTSGRAFVTSIVGKTVTITDITHGTALPVLDISANVAGGTFAPGQTTHCSEAGPGGHMFVGVNNGGAGKDVVLSVDLAAARVDATYKLSVPLFGALWAKCDGSGVIGGVSVTPGASPAANGTATFASVAPDGTVTPGDTVSVPPGVGPTGLLTGTATADHLLATLMPAGTNASAPTVAGFVWAVAPYGGSDDYVTPTTDNLIGAAWDPAGRR